MKKYDHNKFEFIQAAIFSYKHSMLNVITSYNQVYFTSIHKSFDEQKIDNKH